MKLHFLLVGFVIYSISVEAQNNDYDKQVNVNAIGTVSSNTVRPAAKQYLGVKGDPYLLPDFRPGSVLLNDNKLYTDLLLNVDLIGNEVQYKQRKTDMTMVINRKELKECKIQLDFDTTIVVRRFDLPKQPDQLCMVLYERNDAKVLIHVAKEIIKADYSGAYNQGKNYDEIVSKSQFYLMRSDDATIFQLKRKSIMALFPNDQSKLEAYLKTRNPDFKDYSQLRALFNHMLQ